MRIPLPTNHSACDRKWRRWPALRSVESEILTVLCIAAPLVWLVWRRGGVGLSDQAAVFGWVLLAFGLLTLLRPDPLLRVRWPIALVAGLPLVQLLPLGSYREYLLSDSQLSLFEEVATAGIEPFSSLTIYPHATLQAAVVMAGCCGLFILSRALAPRSERSFLICVAAVFAIGVAESAIGLEQYLRAQVEDGGGFAGAHGTLVNKNHYAALLEGCFGLALGILLAGLPTARQGRPPLRWFHVAAAIAAGACLLGAGLSHSRAGAAVVLAMGLVAGVVAVSLTRRLSMALVTAGGMTAMVVAFTALGSWKERLLELMDGTAMARLSIWKDTLRGVQDYWLAGSGLGTFPYAFQRSAMYLPQKTVDHAHNDYLQWLLELGLPGAALLVATLGFFFVTTILRIHQITSHQTPSHLHRMYAIGALLGAGGILTHAWVDFPLRIPAIAALASVLLGCASGLASPAQPRVTASGKRKNQARLEPSGEFSPKSPRDRTTSAEEGRRRSPYGPGFASAAWRFAGGGGALGYALLASLLAGGVFDDWNAETRHAAGQRAFHEGRLDDAAYAWSLALASNPRAAAIWLKRAELVDAAGDAHAALRYAEIAAKLEPFTLRVEWPLAHYRLNTGAEDRAVLGLKTIAAGLPSLRPAVLRAAWAAGLDAASIADLSARCDEESFLDYIAFLARREDWAGIIPAAEALSARCAPFVSAAALWPAFDRLFEANRGAILKELWIIVGQPEPLTKERSNVLETSARDVGPQSEPQAAGFGWIVRPTPGVTVSDSRDMAGDTVLSVEFSQPRNVHYRHLSRDFSVKPNAPYCLRVDVRTEQLEGNEGMRVMVSSPKRFIASSRPIAKTTPWRTLTLNFTTQAGEDIVRVVIARNRGQRLDNLITGRLFVRNLNLRQQPARRRLLSRPEERDTLIQAVADSTS